MTAICKFLFPKTTRIIGYAYFFSEQSGFAKSD